MDTPKTGDEKEMLQAFLDSNRQVMIWKSAEMSDEAARTAPFGSDTSMIGLLQHLAIVERSWLQSFFDGQEVDYGYDFDEDQDAEWHLSGSETLADAVTKYESAITDANAIIDGADLDDLSSKEGREGGQYSMRWIMVHMIEETARHAGHADILREHVDGTVGYMPQLS